MRNSERNYSQPISRKFRRIKTSFVRGDCHDPMFAAYSNVWCDIDCTSRCSYNGCGQITLLLYVSLTLPRVCFSDTVFPDPISWRDAAFGYTIVYTRIVYINPVHGINRINRCVRTAMTVGTVIPVLPELIIWILRSVFSVISFSHL
jgi:hypothetical protein